MSETSALRGISLFAIFAIGAIVAWLSTAPLQKHLLTLWRHARSGSWEVTSRDESLQEFINQHYAGAEWAVHFAAGSPYQFPFDAQNRRETVQMIGQRTPEEKPILVFNSVQLPDAFQSYLVADLESQQKSFGRVGDSERWAALLTLVSHQLGVVDPDHRKKAGDAADALLQNSAQRTEITTAIRNFRAYAVFIRTDLLPYEVYTDPPYDQLEDYTASAVASLTQERRCPATVGSIKGGAQRVNATMRLLPRFTELQIVRPWLASQILEQREQLSDRERAGFFGQEGLLRDIPEKIVVGISDLVGISPAGEDDADAIRGWSTTGMCCAITCADGSSFVVEEGSVRRAGSEFLGARSDMPASVKAIVSRRRIN